MFFSVSVRLSERNISRKAREVRERVGAAGFLLFCPAPFSKSALKEKRTGTVFRYTVTIDQRDRTTAPAVRASRGEARRSEARRGEAKRDDDESGRTGRGRDERSGRDGTGWDGSGRLRDARSTGDATKPDEKGARSRWGSVYRRNQETARTHWRERDASPRVPKTLTTVYTDGR